MSSDYTIAQWEKYEGEDWWEWAVWIEAPAAALDQVESVEWVLHPSFPHPVRKTTERSRKFRLDTAGWGVFPIKAKVLLKDGQLLKLMHQLELHYPDGTATTA